MNKLTKSQWAEARVAYASGIGLRELARNMNIPAGTILARAKREKWTQQIEDAKALIKPKPLQSHAITPMQSVVASLLERGSMYEKNMASLVEKTLPSVSSMSGEKVLDRVNEIEKLDRIARRTYRLDEEAAVNQRGCILNLAFLRSPVRMRPVKPINPQLSPESEARKSTTAIDVPYEVKTS